jgi:hypothetical protein
VEKKATTSYFNRALMLQQLNGWKTHGAASLKGRLLGNMSGTLSRAGNATRAFKYGKDEPIFRSARVAMKRLDVSGQKRLRV